jgi:hypothetical protein
VYWKCKFVLFVYVVLFIFKPYIMYLEACQRKKVKYSVVLLWHKKIGTFTYSIRKGHGYKIYKYPLNG